MEEMMSSAAASPEDRKQPARNVLRLRLSLKGRPIKTLSFTKDVVTVGRDPSADIVLDNLGVSREHVRFELTPSGYYRVEDLGSANGTFLNDEPVKRDYVYNNDVVRIGKYSLWVSFEPDRREQDHSTERRIDPEVLQGTMVLSSGELNRMVHATRDTSSFDRPASPAPEVHEHAGQHAPASGRPTYAWLTVAFVLGTLFGTGITLIFLK
jgi:hypothetical protein